jgi:protein SCO1/2
MRRLATWISTALLTVGACAHDAQPMEAAREDRAARSTVHYTVPAVTLVRDDGQSVRLPAELDDGKPVVLDFIFTSCGSICPLMSQVFSQFQRKLGAEATDVHLVSISTDPEQDTPQRLTEYARQFHAGPMWRHYTGTLDASLAAQRAFDVYRGDKMAHTPVILLRAAPGEPWLRIDGFVTPDELLREYRQLRAAR